MQCPQKPKETTHVNWINPQVNPMRDYRQRMLQIRSSIHYPLHHVQHAHSVIVWRSTLSQLTVSRECVFNDAYLNSLLSAS